MEKSKYIQCKDEELMACDNSVPEFSFEGIVTPAKIVSIYDGDTFRACFRYKGEIHKINCRCLGYDSPEMRPLKKDFETEQDRQEEKANAREAQKFIESVLKPDERLVTLELGEYGKYGRVLVKAYVPELDCSVNEYMVKKGYGVPF